MTQNKISLPQFRMVKSLVESFKKENDFLNTNEKSFLALVLNKYLGLEGYELDDAIIDGSCDGGIDAIYIDDSRDKEDRTIIYLFQSKYYAPQDESKFNKNFEGGALTKMKEAIESFIIRGENGKTYQNSMLQNKIKDINNLEGNPRYEIVFCSNSDTPTAQAREQFENFLDEYNTDNFYSVKYIHLYEVSKLLATEKIKQINAEIPFVGKFIDTTNGDARMFSAEILVVELCKLMEKHGMNLFDKNVRGYLERNKLNQKIKDTAMGDEKRFFSLFNNGITIGCKKMKHTNKESGLLEIEDLQIVNGGQTTNSLYQAYLEDKDSLSGVKVLIKVLEVSNDLLPKIILSTNSQTKITSRDLHSNDDIQKILEEELKGYGYFYEARVEKYKKTNEAFGKRVDALKAAQAYYAIKFSPAFSKTKKSQLFGDFYNIIFDEINGKELLICFLLHQKIRKINKDYKDKFTFVNDASLHLAKEMFDNKINSIEKIDNDKIFNTEYKKVLKAIKEVVDERRLEDGDKYSHRRTFIDDNTKGRIKETYRDSNR